jgi:hypothetical protein
MREKFRIPDILFGGLLTVAIFSLGVLFSSSSLNGQRQSQTAEVASHKPANVGAEERLADYTYWLTWLTGILATSTVGLWVITYLTWQHGRETAERQLRAYLALVRFELDFDKHEFVVVVRNDGQTPGREVIPFFNVQWYEVGHEMPPDFAFPDYEQDPNESGPVSITPGQEHRWSFAFDWKIFEQFNDRKIGPFYFYGRFEYIDVFGERRFNNFCFQAVRFERGGAFRVHSKHNEAT